MGGRHERLIRQWQLIELLRTHRYGLTRRELEQRLERSRATIYRELKLLLEAGVPIVVEEQGGDEKRYRFDQRALPAMQPSAMQLSALVLARESLAPLAGTRCLDELDSLLRHFGARAERPAAVMVSPKRAGGSATVVRGVEAAIEAGRRVRIVYRGVGKSESTARTVEPRQLRYIDDALYLDAFDLEKDDWRTFKLLRVASVEWLRETSSPSRPLPASVARHAVKTWNGSPVDVVIVLDPDVGHLAKEWPLVLDQTLEQRADGAWIVRARVAGIVETMRWVLRWGAKAEALEPKELRAAVASEVAGAAGRYGGEKTDARDRRSRTS